MLPELILAKTVTATTTAATTILATPATFNRVWYVNLSAPTTNSAAVTVTLLFNGGAALYKLTLAPGQLWSHYIGAGARYLQGLTAFEITMDVAQTVHVSVDYQAG